MKRLLLSLIEHAVLRTRDAGRLTRVRNGLLRLAVLLEDRIRQVTTSASGVPQILSADGQTELGVSVCGSKPPWAHAPVVGTRIPGMISEEEQRYYRYLGQFYSGRGVTVELGPWLGLSTCAILEGLAGNSAFRGERLRVFDDFVCRSAWMDKWLADGDPATVAPANHHDFRALFDQYTGHLRDLMIVRKRRIALQDGNDEIPDLEWDGTPIEMLFVDCGRTFEVNEAWYRKLSPSFIPGTTIVVMEDWRTHRETPRQWYNQTKDFTDSKGPQLRLVHELRDGSAAGFLFQGRARS